MKKLIILTILTWCFCTTLRAQTKLPDTVITIHTTNNKLYQLANWMQYALTKLQDSSIPANELKEMTKQYQELMQPIFMEERKQLKVDTSKKKK